MALAGTSGSVGEFGVRREGIIEAEVAGALAKRRVGNRSKNARFPISPCMYMSSVVFATRHVDAIDSRWTVKKNLISMGRQVSSNNA